MNNNLDMDLLALLYEDARRSPEQIAELLGEPVEAIRKKIKTYEDDGVIVKYNTLINWEKVDTHRVYALIEIKVNLHDGIGFDTIAKRMYAYPEVGTMYLVSGGYDFLVQVEGNSLREVAQFVNDKLASMDGVLSTTTHFVLKKYKIENVMVENGEDDRRLVVSP